MTLSWYNFSDDYPRLVVQPTGYDDVNEMKNYSLGW